LLYNRLTAELLQALENKMNKVIIAVIATMLMAGCATRQIDGAVKGYKSAANQVALGDSRDKVLAILLPTQQNLPLRTTNHIKGGATVEIYYMRSGRQAGDLTTDDEITPYVFRDGKLVGIGWNMIGKPKSRGR
jgi:hypothetical protein